MTKSNIKPSIGPFAVLPDKIRILHRDYKVRERDAKEHITTNKLAEIDFVNGEISYVDLGGSEVVDSIIHEVLHGLFRAFDLTDDIDEEEHLVSTLATGLTTVLRDNPDLFRELQKMVNE